MKKGPVMSVPYLNTLLYTVSLTAPDLLPCVDERLASDSNTQHSYENRSLVLKLVFDNESFA